LRIYCFITQVSSSYRHIRERVAALEAREKGLQSNVEDLKTLLNKVDSNGKEKIGCLR
jgi:hypothetical protein